MTKIAVGFDHRGEAAAAVLSRHLADHGHEIDVVSRCDGESCDYPEPAFLVGTAVADGRATRGVLLCGSGIGMAIAANKVHGVRAAVVSDAGDAEMSRRHNDANVVCLSADRLSAADLLPLVDLWLATEFEGGRHARRVEKMAAIERGEDPRGTDGATERRSDEGVAAR